MSFKDSLRHINCIKEIFQWSRIKQYRCLYKCVIYLYMCICALILVDMARAACSAKKSKPGAKSNSKVGRTVSTLRQDTVPPNPCGKSRSGLVTITMVSCSPAGQAALQWQERSQVKISKANSQGQTFLQNSWSKSQGKQSAWASMQALNTKGKPSTEAPHHSFLQVIQPSHLRLNGCTIKEPAQAVKHLGWGK